MKIDSIISNLFGPEHVAVTFAGLFIIVTCWAIMDYIRLMSKKKRMSEEEIADAKTEILYNNYKWFFLALVLYLIYRFCF